MYPSGISMAEILALVVPASVPFALLAVPAFEAAQFAFGFAIDFLYHTVLGLE